MALGSHLLHTLTYNLAPSGPVEAWGVGCGGVRMCTVRPFQLSVASLLVSAPPTVGAIVSGTVLKQPERVGPSALRPSHFSNALGVVSVTGEGSYP